MSHPVCGGGVGSTHKTIGRWITRIKTILRNTTKENLISGIHAKAGFIVRYSGPFLNWTGENTYELTGKKMPIRKEMMMFTGFTLKRNWVHKMTLSNSESERESSWEEELFSDSCGQNLSLHPRCQDIVLSTSWQMWDFLPSCCGCLLTLWLEICPPNDNFVFSGVIVKLPAKFCLYNFEWFHLQISSEAKFVSSLIQGIVIKDW